MPDQRLPIVNSDDGIWGDILRSFLAKEHYNDDTNNPANGGHKTITIRAGTAAANTAPLKFTSGSLLTVPEAGAVEFNTDTLYFTQTTGTTRKKLAAYDDASGAAGDIYYRDTGGMFTRLGVGGNGTILQVNAGLPSWQAAPNPAQYTPTAVWGDSYSTGSIMTGTVTYVRVPYGGTISSWHIVADVAITCTLDVWKAAGALPTVANTITAAAKPLLSSATTASSSTLTGWTTAVSAGDVFGFRLDSLSAGSPKLISLTLNIA